MNEKRIIFGAIGAILVVGAVLLATGYTKSLLNGNKEGSQGPGTDAGHKELSFESILKDAASTGPEQRLYTVKNEGSQASIITVFSGMKGSGGHAIEINNIIETENTIIVYLTETAPGRGCFVTEALTYPFQVVRTENLKKKVEFIVREQIIHCDTGAVETTVGGGSIKILPQNASADDYLPGSTGEPPTSTIKTNVYVDRVEVAILESFPVQVVAVVKGNLPDSCASVEGGVFRRGDYEFTIILEGRRPENLFCAQVLTPFEKSFGLDVYGLKKGTYKVVVQEVQTQFTLDVDNIIG